MNKRILYLLILLTGIQFSAFAQISLNKKFEVNYAKPKEYEIGGITVTGGRNLNNNVLIMLSGLQVGEKIMIPGTKISDAMEKLWDQGLFSELNISVTKEYNGLIFLDIYIQERARLSKFSFKGVRKSEADDLREEIKLTTGDMINEHLILSTKEKAQNYLDGKLHEGFC